MPLVKLELEKMEKDEIIFSIRNSKWISNLVVVQKKNALIYLCVDFEGLNKASLNDNYLISNMESLLQQVIGSDLVSILDIFLGCNQALMAKQDKYKTTFTTLWETYACNRILFRLKMLEIPFIEKWIMPLRT